MREFAEPIQPAVERALAGEPEVIELSRTRDASIHILVTQLTDEHDGLLGALATVHDISYLDERGETRRVQFAFAILLVIFLLLFLVVAIIWAAYERPLKNLAQWMHRLRTEDVAESPPGGLPGALLARETERLAASFRAARSTADAHSRLAIRDHKVWTRDRLRDQALDCLHGGQLVVVSNREPYMHQLREGKPCVIVPAAAW